MIDPGFITRTLTDLVRINSINPSLTPGMPGEMEIADYTSGIANELGLEVQTIASVADRPSVLARRPGSGSGKSLMFNAHYDTVGVEGMADPFSGRIEEGKLFGRGAYDMKGALAACLGAVKALNDSDVALQGDLVVAAVADEEHASLGMRDVIEAGVTDGAIVTEPSQLGVCLAHKGFMWVEIKTQGRAAHGSQFGEGVDANMHMGRVLRELELVQRRFESSSGHPLVGPPSLHAALIKGGTAASVYSSSSSLTVERRTIPGESESQVMGEITQIIEKLRAEDEMFEASASAILVRDPFEVRRDAGVVRAVAEATEAVLGDAPKYVGENPWMDSALLADAGVEAVVMGPSGGGAHSDVEWVELASVHQLADILARAAIIYCGT